MARYLKIKKSDALAGVGVALRGLRDSADVFPPLKSIVAAVVIVWEMSKKVKSNRRECKRLAHRAEEIVRDIWRQTKDYGDELPDEVEHSISQIEQIFRDIIAFMKQLQGQGLIKRYARQDDNKDQVEQFNKVLDEALQEFSINLQLSVHRRLIVFQLASRERHDEVLDVSRTSESEREVRAADVFHLLDYYSMCMHGIAAAPYGNTSSG